jgi:hypothetical protein
VVVEGVVAEGEKDLVPPSSVGGGGRVKDDGDQVLEVRDPGDLKVEVGDHGVNLAKLGSGTLLKRSSGRCLVGGGGDVLHLGGVEEVLRLGDTASEDISRGALVLPSEGCHTHVLLSSGGLGLGSRKSHGEGSVGSRDAGGSRRLASQEGSGEEGRVHRRHP